MAARRTQIRDSSLNDYNIQLLTLSTKKESKRDCATRAINWATCVGLFIGGEQESSKEPFEDMQNKPENEINYQQPNHSKILKTTLLKNAKYLQIP